jgi:hypothetical protein
MQKLGGWWRLWILSMLAWTASVAGYCYQSWPTTTYAAHDPAFIEQLSTSQRALLVRKNEAMAGLQVEMPNEYILRFKPEVEEEAAEKLAGAYHDLTVRAQDQSNQKRAKRFLVIALLPSLAVAVLGIGVAWVRRGFTEQRS